MRTTRRSSRAVLCAGLCALVISFTAIAQSHYLAPLPTEPDALAVNNNTQVLYGSGLYSSNIFTPFPAGFVGWALSESGVVAGSTFAAPTHLAIYTAGVVSDLGALPAPPNSPPTQAVYPSSINASGQIAGTLDNGTFGTGFVYSNGAVSWIPGAVSANSLNDNGQVVGCSTIVPAHPEAFIFVNGALTDIGPGCANAINASGEITGWAGATFQNGHAFIQVNGKLTLLMEPPPYTASAGSAINNGGQVVGTLETAQTTVGFFLME